MRRRVILLTASTILATATPAIAQDQEQTTAFRVELGGDSAETGVPASYAWLENIGACSTTCGTGTRVTSYQCQNIADFNYASGGYGAPEDEAYCTHSEGAKPANRTSSCTVYSGCSYDWVNPPVEQTPIPLGSNPVGRVGCGYVNQVFSPYCQRTGGDGTVIMDSTDHEFCSGDRPDYDNVASGDPDALGYDRNVTQTGACTTVDHDWQRGAWGPWSSTCSATATRTRTVTCERRFDGSTQPNSNCDQSEDHAAVDVQPIYSGCSYERGTTVTNTGPWASGCSSSTTRTLTYNCLRSDGTTVAASECTSRGVSLTRTETGSNYASCTYDWVPDDSTTGWGPSSDTCSSSATQTRSVVCRRSDGTNVSDSNCSGPRPASSRTVADYSTCSYARGAVTNTGAWASGCSSNTTRTLTHACRRSDGTNVSASECTSRGVSLTTTETGSNYAGCSYTWNTGSWGPSSNRCTSSATQTRSVTCQRSDGSTVADSNCSGAKPASSRTVADYSSCSYARGAVTGTGEWASGCSSNTSRILTHACRRSDGTNVAASECIDRGIRLTTTETGSNYAGCSYAWNTGSWGPSSNTCSASAIQTRSVTCRRGDGTTVADSSCSGTKPASSRTVADYSSCSYSWNTGSWSASSNQCSSSATQTRSVTCRRSNGTTVADSNCSGAKPATSRTVADYSACTYSWNVSGWGPSSSTCSGSATQTRSVICRRSNGSTVADSNCSGAKPTTSRSVADYSGCSYGRGNATGFSWSSTCSANATRTTTHECRRSDGTTVSASECTSRGVSLTTTTTGPNYSSCTYSPTYDSTWGACNNGTQTRAMTSCTRNVPSGNQTVSTSECTSRGHPAQLTQSCSSRNVCSPSDQMYDQWSRVWPETASDSECLARSGGRCTETYYSRCVSRGGNCVVTAQIGAYEGEQNGSWEYYRTWCHNRRSDGTYTTIFDEEWVNR